MPAQPAVNRDRAVDLAGRLERARRGRRIIDFQIKKRRIVVQAPLLQSARGAAVVMEQEPMNVSRASKVAAIERLLRGPAIFASQVA